MAIVGYGRVSSHGQSLDVQKDKLQAYGCTKLFVEKQSGKKTSNRPALQECLNYLREGDSLVITKLDRLGRSVLDLHKIIFELKNKKVNFVCIDQNIDTKSAQGRLMFAMLSAVAEFENDLRAERQAEGILKAKENGVKFGREEKLTKEEKQLLIEEYLSSNKSKQSIANKFNISRATLYRICSKK